MKSMIHETGTLEPKYNLGWVVRQTGISADTIRAWEKRYGLPAPQRSDGNQRLYSDHDVQVLIWLQGKIQEGVQISKAVSLLQEHGFTNEQESREHFHAMETWDQPTDEMHHMMQQWVDACIKLDDDLSSFVLDQAFSIFSHQLASRYVVFAGVKAMESLWLSGQRGSQYLHYARQAASRKIYTLMGAYPASLQTAGTLVLATVMEEEDPFRPVYLAYLAKMAGWKTVNAGPQMIAEPLVQIINETQATALVLVANQLHTAANAFTILQTIQDKHIPVFFCGTFFEIHPELQTRFPGVFLEEPWTEQIFQMKKNLRDASQKKGGALQTSCRQLMKQYQQQRVVIEQETQKELAQMALQDQHFAMANYFMQRGIHAAMTLGDLSYLEEDLVWIHRLISNMGFGKSVMPAYALVYRKSILKVGAEGLESLAAALTYKNQQLD
jgi:DNA-binding transcriptional MerR regulator